MAMNRAVITPQTPLRTFHPRWPTLTSIESDGVVFAYWQEVDTLMVDFFGRGRSAVSVPLLIGDRDYLFLRVDPVSEDVIGLQIEDFLAYAVGADPLLLDALDLADLHGITREEIPQLQRARAGTRDKHAVVTALVKTFASLGS